MWVERDFRPVLEQISGQRPVVLLTGCRQSGKTSLLESAFPAHRYVSLDLPLEAERAETSGEAFLAEHAPPVIIDEIQYAPQLLRHIKHEVDRHRDAVGRYLLTGSQKLALMQGVSESLAGRVAVLELHSLSLREIERAFGALRDTNGLLERLWQGGYPELHARQLDPKRFYADYVATYLERDVRQAINVRSLRDFDRFVRLCALRSGQLLNMNGLAGDVGVSPNTVRSWLSVLEASNVVYLLPPYFSNPGKRLVKAPKLYFLDTGLLCHLAGLRSVDELKNSALLGAFFETLALGQLIRAHANRALSAPVYYYRDHQGNEVDFVVPVGERAHLIECKWGEEPKLGRGMHAVERALGTQNVLSRSVVSAQLHPVERDGVTYRSVAEFEWLFAGLP
jgi:predicted AAA+ superfamily ATPase